MLIQTALPQDFAQDGVDEPGGMAAFGRLFDEFHCVVDDRKGRRARQEGDLVQPHAQGRPHGRIEGGQFPSGMFPKLGIELAAPAQRAQHDVRRQAAVGSQLFRVAGRGQPGKGRIEGFIGPGFIGLDAHQRQKGRPARPADLPWRRGRCRSRW